MDGRGRLRNHINVITFKDKLILLCFGLCNHNTIQHADMSHSFLAQKVTDLDSSAIVLDNAVNGEMSVDGTHFVSEALGDTVNHIVDQTLDRPQACNMLPSSLPNGERNFGAFALDQPDVHVDMLDVLCEGTAGASYRNDTGFEGHGDSLWDFEFFGLEDVPHLE